MRLLFSHVWTGRSLSLFLDAFKLDIPLKSISVSAVVDFFPDLFLRIKRRIQFLTRSEPWPNVLFTLTATSFETGWTQQRGGLRGTDVHYMHQSTPAWAYRAVYGTVANIFGELCHPSETRRSKTFSSYSWAVQGRVDRNPRRTAVLGLNRYLEPRRV